MNKIMISISLNANNSHVCAVERTGEAGGEVEKHPLKNVFSGRKRFMGEKTFFSGSATMSESIEPFRSSLVVKTVTRR